MKPHNEFVVGQHYSNDEIRFSLEVGNLGGIRTSVDAEGRLRHIAVMTTTPEGKQDEYANPYQDRIEGEVLTFTGSGRKGDQLLEGANKRLTEQLQWPVPVFGFSNHGRQSYEFLGLLELLRFYREQQVDRSKTLRSVCVFEFKIHTSPNTVPITLASELTKSILAVRKSEPEAEQEVLTQTLAGDAQEELLKTEDLRSKLLTIDPYAFEHLIKAVAEKSGFESVSVTRRSGDGGIDLNAVTGPSYEFFGGTRVQFQAKRWRHAVGSIEINSFRGAMSSTAKGIFITTSHYTRAAIENAYHPEKPCVTLLDGSKFAAILLRIRVDLSTFTT